MNVIVANKEQGQLSNLDVDIIKSMNGEYSASELVEMFKSFFYSKMILDVSALKDYTNINTYKTLISGLDPEKIIFLLPEGSKLCTPVFLSNLISIGIYNFTTSLNGIKFLLKKSNTLKDVEHITNMAKKTNSTKKGENSSLDVKETDNHVVPTTKVNDGTTVIGFKNVTDHAGATTLIYMLKKELTSIYGRDSVVAIEIDKNDFSFFNDKNMISIKEADLGGTLKKYSSVNFILIDLNSINDDSSCSDVFYLFEPSTIKINKLIRRNKTIFSKLINKKVILNNSLLTSNDVFDFESEAGIKIFYNIPPLDERKNNSILNDFLNKIGLVSGKNNSNKIFGLFRK